MLTSVNYNTKLKKYLILSVVILTVLPLFGQEPREFITVTNVQEFVESIAPNRTLYLKSGEYILKDSEYSYKSPYVSYGGGHIHIKKADNLTLIGEDGATILAHSRSAITLPFYDSDNLTLNNLIIGHTNVPEWDCVEGVVFINDSDNVTIANCKIYGSGTIGVTAKFCDNLKMKNSEITECTRQIIDFTNVTNSSIVSCKFHNNSTYREFGMMMLWKSSNIQFEDCLITENVATEQNEYEPAHLIGTGLESSDIVFKGCKILNNKVGVGGSRVEFINTEIKW